MSLATPLSSPELMLFAHVVGLGDAELDLAEVALVLAQLEYPDLDVARYLAQLNAWGDSLPRGASGPIQEASAPLLRLVYEELGFAGNHEDYYDPRNSFLNDVIDRRLGIPITMADVVLHLAKRSGVVAHGVSFPGHFLVRLGEPSEVSILDPLSGKFLSRRDLEHLQQRATGKNGPLNPKLFGVAKSKQILARMLVNLRAIYDQRHDSARLAEVLERLLILHPTEEVRAELDTVRRGVSRVRPLS